MKPVKFKNCVAQGELYVERIETLPETETLRAGEQDDNGNWIVGHSESGHHHVLFGKAGRLLEGANPDICYFVSEEAALFELTHCKPHNDLNPAHAPTISAPGIFRIRRQSEVRMGQRLRVQD